VIAAKCPYHEIPGIFKRGNPFSGKRGEIKTFHFVKPICFGTSLNFNHTFKGESKLIYVLGHLGGSPFKDLMSEYNNVVMSRKSIFILVSKQNILLSDRSLHRLATSITSCYWKTTRRKTWQT